MDGLADQERSEQAVQAVEDLCRADTALGRRRRASGSLSNTDRDAVGFIHRETGQGRSVSPSDLSRHLRISTASVSILLDRLEAQGRISVAQHESDRRRKVITSIGAVEGDVLGDAVRDEIADLTAEDAEAVIGFLERVADRLHLDADAAPR